MRKEQIDFLNGCAELYRSDLVNDILPFWLKHGLDRVNGGIYTCLDRQGTVMDTTKSVWFQGRFAYTCSLAYNLIEKREEWLQAAASAIGFIEKHCFDADGHMFFTVAADGTPIRKRRYVFSECFAMAAMAEYAKASGERSYADKALALFRRTQTMLGTKGFLPAKSFVESRGHSIMMMLIWVASTIRGAVADEVLDRQIEQSMAELRDYFMHPEFETILETTAMDGSLIDTWEGRTINPGHCLETAWFIWDANKGDKAAVEMGSTIAKWAWKWGWDEPYGGIINFRDCKNFPHQDYSQDMKFWWPQTEAIIATLYGYLVTGEEQYLEWHRMAHEYAYKHFPDKRYGEWYGYLHRDGTVAQDAKGNIYKGPFHIPRMMIIASILCQQILTGKTQTI